MVGGSPTNGPAQAVAVADAKAPLSAIRLTTRFPVVRCTFRSDLVTQHILSWFCSRFADTHGLLAQEHLLRQAQLRTAAAQLARNASMRGIIRGVIAVEQIRLHSADLNRPGAQPDRVTRQCDLQPQPLAVRLGTRIALEGDADAHAGNGRISPSVAGISASAATDAHRSRTGAGFVRQRTETGVRDD